MSEQSTGSEGRRPIRRALVSVYDKTGLEDLATALARRRRRHRLDRVDGGPDRGGRCAGDRGRGADRLPGVPRRPGQDAAPAGARRPARRRGQPRPRRAAGRAGHRAVRARRLQPLPVPRHRGLRCEPGRVHRADRHRRTVDGARRGEEPRQRRRRRLAGPVRRGGRRRDVRRLHAGPAPAPGRRGVRPHRVVRRGGGVLDGLGAGAARPTARGSRTGPARRGRSATCCATARTRTSARPSTPTGGPGVAQAEVLHGKAMSYNNYVDTDAAVRAAFGFDQPAVAIIKHANPCGIAVADDIATAHAKAHACDPVSAYGGVVAANRPVSLAMAQQLTEGFTEVVAAPSFDDDAYELLSHRKAIRLLELPERVSAGPVEFRPISGGVLVQTVDRVDAVVEAGEGTEAGGDDPTRWRLACGEPADDATLADLAFAWKAIRAVRSNAILLAHDGASVGVGHGAGQPGRLLPTGGRPGRGRARTGERCCVGRLLPVRRRSSGAHRCRCTRGRAAGRVDPRRGRDRSGSGRGGHDVPHRHPPLHPLPLPAAAWRRPSGRRAERERGRRGQVRGTPTLARAWS